MSLKRSSLFTLSLLSLSLFLSASFLPYFSSAQTLPGDDPISITLNPQNPKPNQNVTVQLQGLGIDINSSDISWYVNDAKISGGIGQTSVVIRAGSNGSVSNVTAVVITPNGAEHTQTIAIAPVTVDLIWDAHSYTPPFYKGKGLYPYQGTITVTALANIVSNGSIVNPKSLVYTWKKDGEVIGSASGYGKDSITLTSSVIIRALNISVNVATRDGSITGTGNTTINPINPTVILYEESPFYGTIYSRALENVLNLKTAEIQVRAAPYYFSTFTPYSSSFLGYNWTVNGKSVALENNDKSSISLRPPQDTKGSSNVGVKVTESSSLLQYVTKGVTINYDTRKQ